MASTCPIFKQHEIANFKMSMSGCNRHPHRLIIIHRNDTKSNLKKLLDVSYNWGGTRWQGFLDASAHLIDLRQLLLDGLFLLRKHLHVHLSMHGAANLGPALALPMYNVGYTSAGPSKRKAVPAAWHPSPVSSSHTLAGRGAAPLGRS